MYTYKRVFNVTYTMLVLKCAGSVYVYTAVTPCTRGAVYVCGSIRVTYKLFSNTCSEVPFLGGVYY